MFTPFISVLSDIGGTIRKHAQKLDRPVIGVMPAYFPLELIHASGGYPIQLWGADLPVEYADIYLQSYCCSVARSALELEMQGRAQVVRAYVFTSICDTLINLRELYRRLFDKPSLEFSIPVTASVSARRAYFHDVIPRILKGIEAVTGRSVSRDTLRASAREYAHVRCLQRELYRIRRERPGAIRNADFYAVIKAGFFMPVEDYGRLLEELISHLRHASASRGKRVTLMMTGMVFDPLAAQAFLDEIGADVVDDDFANGWRSASRDILPVDDLLEGIMDHLFAAAPCCCLYHPEHDRHAYLVRKVKDAGAKGVVFWHTKFCEPDAFDRPQLLTRLKQEEIPTIVVETEVSMATLDSLKTRLQAFCEMLEG
jgi:bcr-type benzoyl-CoA reductase subunit C